MFKTYFIAQKHNRDKIKIGKSYNPEKRLQSLQSTLGLDLVLLKVVNFDIESALHLRFKDISIGGEWFDDDGSISSLIENNDLIDEIINKQAILDFGLSDNFDYSDCIKTIDGFFVATELVKKANKTRKVKFNLSQWLKTSSVLKLSERVKDKTNLDAIIVTRGNNGKVLLSPAIFSLLLSSLSIDFKINSLTSSSMLGELSQSDFERNETEMIGTLFLNSKNKSLFHKELQNLMDVIKKNDVSDASMPKVFKEITELCSIFSNDEAVRLALEKNK